MLAKGGIGWLFVVSGFRGLCFDSVGEWRLLMVGMWRGGVVRGKGIYLFIYLFVQVGGSLVVFISVTAHTNHTTILTNPFYPGHSTHTTTPPTVKTVPPPTAEFTISFHDSLFKPQTSNLTPNIIMPHGKHILVILHCSILVIHLVM